VLFRRFEECDDFADGIPQGVNGALGSCAQKRFKFGKGHFDGVEVGTVGREIEQPAASSFDGLADTIGFVSRQVIHDDSITRTERRHENLFDVGQECRTVHRAVEDHRCRHAGKPERACKGRGFPVSVGNGRPAALSA